MREHRWESQAILSFEEILQVADRIATGGLTPATPEKDVICYIEEWEVEQPRDFQKLDYWPTEDVTLIHILESWVGDFFLLAGGYHTVFQRHQSVNTYCSICHPWKIDSHLVTLLPHAMFWVGFRHAHSFIRVRVHTTDIVAPGETWADHQRPMWIEERQATLQSAIKTLDLPIEATTDRNRVILHTSRSDTPLFCSWPDAFGPSQFEFNSPDPFEFLVPASQLASTYHGQPAAVRVYLTGFSIDQLDEFTVLKEKAGRMVYRCSAHCTVNELPDILETLGQSGRVYTTLCEFQTEQVLPHGRDSAAIIGIVATKGQYQIEVRLSQSPLTRPETTQWLEELLGLRVDYAPLSAFP